MDHRNSSCSTDSPVLALPADLGGWRLELHAGEGTLSHVYRAQPRAHDSASTCPDWVAVKVLKQQWEFRPAARAMFAREAQVAAEVQHPNLITVLEAHLDVAPCFCVLPWLDGVTLDQRIAGGRRLPSPLALWLVRQVAEALAALHAADWTHGDVKPENIFVSPIGHATLIDLGFARHRHEQAAGRPLTGTPYYMAPEVLQPERSADIRSDLYSLGVLFYQLLTGRLPFRSTDLGELARLHREARPLPLADQVPSASAELGELIYSLLAKDPLCRPQTPRELVHRLVALEVNAFGQRLSA